MHGQDLVNILKTFIQGGTYVQQKSVKTCSQSKDICINKKFEVSQSWCCYDSGRQTIREVDCWWKNNPCKRWWNIILIGIVYDVPWLQHPWLIETDLWRFYRGHCRSCTSLWLFFWSRLGRGPLIQDLDGIVIATCPCTDSSMAMLDFVTGSNTNKIEWWTNYGFVAFGSFKKWNSNSLKKLCLL